MSGIISITENKRKADAEREYEQGREAMKKRDERYDNLRAFLILCVVSGHFLETCPGRPAQLLYLGIYFFHIPALLFVAGRFASFSPKRVFADLMTYLVFQYAYLWFDAAILNHNRLTQPQFTTPYWLLWYMLALVGFRFLLPLLDGLSEKGQRRAVVILAIASLLVGFDQSVGYYLTLSRFWSFAPYYAAGYVVGKQSALRTALAKLTENRAAKLLFPLCTLLLSALLLHKNLYTPVMLYGSYSYAAGAYSWQKKALLLLLGTLWLISLLILTPKKKLPLWTALGRNTLPVFLFHGFVIKYWRTLPHPPLYWKRPLAYSLVCGLLTTAILALPLFSFPLRLLRGERGRGKRPKE